MPVVIKTKNAKMNSGTFTVDQILKWFARRPNVNSTSESPYIPMTAQRNFAKTLDFQNFVAYGK